MCGVMYGFSNRVDGAAVLSPLINAKKRKLGTVSSNTETKLRLVGRYICCTSTLGI